MPARRTATLQPMTAGLPSPQSRVAAEQGSGRRSFWTPAGFPADMRPNDTVRRLIDNSRPPHKLGGPPNDPVSHAPARRGRRADPCGRRPGAVAAARTQADGARCPRRRMGSDRASDAASPGRRQDRPQRPGHQRGRRRWQRRHRAVRQRRQGRRQPVDGERLRHGGRAGDEQIARDARPGDADCAPHRGDPGDRRAGEFADQDGAGSCRCRSRPTSPRSPLPAARPAASTM